MLQIGQFSRVGSVRLLFRHTKQTLLRHISITCRGNPICKDDLFRYTNGRFLIDEERQFHGRYAKFNVDELCSVAAASGGSESPIIAIDKMEGGFCKALLMKKADGTEVVAKLPTKRAGPPQRLTESEALTDASVQEHTTIPVPKVLAWSSNSSNKVGSEYILMEKAPGVQLWNRWPKMNGSSKLAIIEHLVKLESQFGSIEFPCSGSLYFRDEIKDINASTPLSKELDPRQSYCVGPTVNSSWHYELHPGASSIERDNSGPWCSLSDYGRDLIQREISKISQRQEHGGNSHSQPDSKGAINDLTAATKVLEVLESCHPKLTSLSKPTLWHTDLHLGNIFISEDDPSKIVSIIDWQSTSIGPLFLQVTWPEFLKPTDEYMCGLVRPLLPEKFEELDEFEKKRAIHTRDNALLTKTYELSSWQVNKGVVYSALNLPSVFREIFIRCGESADQGTTGLRACLAELFQLWRALDISGECPISFSAEELSDIEQEFERYRERSGIQEFAREYLETDVEGWISLERDFAEIQLRNKIGLQKYINEMSKRMSPS
ncbi:hypothetical protein LOZ53_002478 [Ophidiomyces ophidiicola]|nr:hypothetical protein LOZ55_003842 [Ophidiomyces ophidiicola]KAI1990396.1 hypothetical protein LOZ54_002497 [Ophidiomyces ophidiicola]KAI1992420.1 hypothetical protein LOZ53_002478 [Ophidiomyces ophidiicola]KAI1998432.1 hypothetical protein LOZ51_002163 [Ophidiomyces ophidiicola]